MSKTETVTLQKIGQEVLEELKEFNKRTWDAIHFSLIYAQMKEELELKKLDTDRNVREYRKERYEKALKLAKGDKMKAYNLLASEDFY
ncbi:hypothetical protein HYX16_03605 [Candidatus Woesearchaeota archaeon]|nr:hypothetical protein [Candidatus Woesearchaeota archaeon]